MPRNTPMNSNLPERTPGIWQFFVLKRKAFQFQMVGDLNFTWRFEERQEECIILHVAKSSKTRNDSKDFGPEKYFNPYTLPLALTDVN